MIPEEAFAQSVHELVDDILRDRAAFEHTQVWSDDRERRRHASDVMSLAAKLSAILAGPAVRNVVYENVTDMDRTQTLRVIQNRLEIARLVFGEEQMIEHDAASLTAVIREAEAVEDGDKPVIFARIGAVKIKSRLQWAKLTALQLEAYGSGLGIPTAKRHAIFVEAFNQEWDTISRWTKQAPIKADKVVRALARARAAGRARLKAFNVQSVDDAASPFLQQYKQLVATAARRWREAASA